MKTLANDIILSHRAQSFVVRCFALCLLVLGISLPMAANGAGEETSAIVDARYDREKRAVVYRLDKPSRATIRAGIDGGPLLKTVLVGAMRQAGEHAEPWDGMDESGVVEVVSQKGFLLQAEAVGIESGRGGGAKLKVRFGDSIESSGGVPVVAGQAVIEVSVDGPPGHDWAKPAHEVIFFVDFQFLQELEGESLPAALSWDTRETGNGEHVLTVNVVAPGGEVSAGSARVEVRNPEAGNVRR